MAGKVLPSAQDIADKQVTRVAGATEAYKKGIARVTEAPGAAAARKRDKYVQRVIETQDKWAQNVASVPLNQWADAAIRKGATNLGTGITYAKDKLVAFWSDFLPVLQNNVNQVNSMPSDTYEQRKAKAAAMMDLNHQYSRRRR